MARPDPFLNMFSDIGFLPVRLPRADVNPLLLLEADGKDLNPLGDIETALQSGTARPEAKPDVTTAGAVQGSRTSRIKLGIGIDLLSSLISAMAGTSLNVNAAYKDAESVRFEFTDVLVNRVDVTQLDGFLSGANIRPEMRHVSDLLRNGKVCAITATVKSRKFLVTAQDEDGLDIAVSVPVIQNAVSGKVNVGTEGSSENKIAYEGAVPVVFGIQAIRLFFDDSGKYTAFKALKSGAASVRKPGEQPPPEDVEVVSVDGIFANIGAPVPGK